MEKNVKTNNIIFIGRKLFAEIVVLFLEKYWT